jgi:hypothetical protein
MIRSTRSTRGPPSRVGRSPARAPSSSAEASSGAIARARASRVSVCSSRTVSSSSPRSLLPPAVQAESRQPPRLLLGKMEIRPRAVPSLFQPRQRVHGPAQDIVAVAGGVGQPQTPSYLRDRSSEAGDDGNPMAGLAQRVRTCQTDHTGTDDRDGRVVLQTSYALWGLRSTTATIFNGTLTRCETRRSRSLT